MVNSYRIDTSVCISWHYINIMMYKTRYSNTVHTRFSSFWIRCSIEYIHLYPFLSFLWITLILIRILHFFFNLVSRPLKERLLQEDEASQREHLQPQQRLQQLQETSMQTTHYLPILIFLRQLLGALQRKRCKTQNKQNRWEQQVRWKSVGESTIWMLSSAVYKRGNSFNYYE